MHQYFAHAFQDRNTRVCTGHGISFEHEIRKPIQTQCSYLEPYILQIGQSKLKPHH
jgi:hypothetical protein